MWLAAGTTDMRRGFDGLSRQVQHVLGHDPFSGHLFFFRGRLGELVKSLFWDTQGLALYAKRLERGRFVWPAVKEGVIAHAGNPLDALGRHRLAHARAHVAAGDGGVTPAPRIHAVHRRRDWHDLCPQPAPWAVPPGDRFAMALDLAALPDDVDALRAIVAAQVAELATKNTLIDALRLNWPGCSAYSSTARRSGCTQ